MINRRELMKMAWEIRKNNYSTVFGECLKAAWALLKQEATGKLWIKPGIARIYEGKNYKETRTSNVGEARKIEEEKTYNKFVAAASLVENQRDFRGILRIARSL